MSASKPTPDQVRAKHAWAEVDKLFDMEMKDGKEIKKPKSHAKAFGSAARKLPVRIMSSGLGQALAFLRAKNKTQDLLEALGDWVLGERTQTALLDAIVNGDADSMRQQTAESLAYLQWLNRFCEAEKLSEDTEAE
jgi:CRISPR-associated protein Cmr5